MLCGSGNPGGGCAACPMNQFGSAINGHGKACKEVRLFFLLRKGEVLPDVVQIPPGSLKNVRKYLTSLPVPFWSVVTKLTLEKKTNVDGITYSQIKATMGGMLDEASRATIQALMERFAESFSNIQVDGSMDHGETEEV
jgi:hypothetical protein